MREPTLFVLIGVSGVGKSTFAKLWEVKTRSKIVSTDYIRGALFGDEKVQKEGSRVFQVAYMEMQAHLNHSRNVIFDATNTTRKGRNELLEKAGFLPCKKVAVLMPLDLDRAIRQNKKRERVVPEHVLRRQHDQLLQEGDSILEQFDELVFVKG